MWLKAGIVLALSLLSPGASCGELFTLALPECDAGVERRSADDGVPIVRSTCPLSLSSLATLLDAALRTWYPGHDLPLRAIYLGRLMNYPDWSRQLAIAAAHSKDWDARRGRPRRVGESDNRRVRRMLNGQVYPQALAPVFVRYGLLACIDDVEKVLVFPAKVIGVEGVDRISGDARLPADAQIWLTFKPLPQSCSEDVSSTQVDTGDR